MIKALLLNQISRCWLWVAMDHTAIYAMLFPFFFSLFSYLIMLVLCFFYYFSPVGLLRNVQIMKL